MKYMLIAFILIAGTTGEAQNMIPNPSFENVSSYTPGSVLFNCADEWKDNYYLLNPAMNSADLCYNGSTFFASILAYDGIRYAGIDCEKNNPEYIQVKMTSAMAAGTTYCVSFYTSLFNQWNTPAPFLGAYFSTSRLTINPYTASLPAHVEGTGPTDGITWKQVSGMYTALGGEEYITLGCFHDNPSLLSYMYIDMVDVHPVISSVDLGNDQTICDGEQIILDAGNGGTHYHWSTGETTSSIRVTTAGMYWVEKYNGACALKDEIILFTEGCIDSIPAIPAEPTYEEVLYLPNSFSPNDDGINDLFGAKGEGYSDFELIIFNRFGQRIFSSGTINELWDGTFNKQPAPEDAYVYMLNYRKDKKELYRTGTIVLVR